MTVRLLPVLLPLMPCLSTRNIPTLPYNCVFDVRKQKFLSKNCLQTVANRYNGAQEKGKLPGGGARRRR
jgi:hypothetical protein